MIEGAAILLAGILIGVLGDRLLSRNRAKSPSSPMCGCGHSIAYHDLKAGACHSVGKAESGWDRYGSANEWSPQPCTCRRYSGPEPLPEYYAPELGSAGPPSDQ
jgi:hypothetical protein